MRNILVLILFFTFLAKAQENEFQITEGLIEYEGLFDKSMNDSASCYRIPALVTAPNGNLIAAIDERIPSCGDLKWNRDINIVIRRSCNDGKTWSRIKTIVDFPLGKSASDPSMIVDNITNEIFLFYNYMDLDSEKEIYYFHVIKSSDNGKTWGKPIDITSQITKPEWHSDFKFITSGRGIQTNKGILLHCLVNLDNGMHVFGSRDHGKTWFFVDTPISPADESKIIELVTGGWSVNSRVNKKGLRYVHSSTDEGETWATRADAMLIDPGCNASIIRYTSVKNGFKKNRLLFSNVKSAKGRKNLTVRISYDEGKTWSDGKTVYKGSAAYSSLTILKNGDIGLFFEKDEYSENVFVSFSLKWLTDNEDEYIKPEKKK